MELRELTNKNSVGQQNGKDRGNRGSNQRIRTQKLPNLNKRK